MNKRFVFHYNGDMKATEEEERKFLDPDELTTHEMLSKHDGEICTADPNCHGFCITTGKTVLTAYFDDGDEQTVYLSELTEVN